MHQFSRQFEISTLINLYQNGNITDKQDEILKTWIRESPENKLLFNELVDLSFCGSKLEHIELINRNDIWAKTLIKLQTSDDEFKIAKSRFPRKEGHHIISSFWPKLAIAVTLIITLGVGVWFLTKNRTLITIQQAKNDILPGGNGATLSLADGRKIKLSDITKGLIANVSGSKVNLTEAGKIEYKQNHSAANKIEYNVLTTSLGERYQLQLPDGTNVWLNSGTTIKFPTNFNSMKTRTVNMSGEAYFEVKSDKKHPFIVKSNGQEIQVLGTHFNVSNYPDDKIYKTTLLEGSIKLITPINKTILFPGQQAINDNRSIVLNEIDPSISVAWKNGEFYFLNENLGSIMKVIGRWYNVEFSYTDPSLINKSFSARVSCSKNILDVLKKFELTGNVKFKIQGRRIVVSK